MQIRHLRRHAPFAFVVLLALGVLGCDDPGEGPGGDAATVDGAAVDARTDAAPDAGDGCATPPVGDWAGTASIRYSGSAGYEEMSANVLWMRVSTAACVDHYQPSGTVRSDGSSGSEEECEEVEEPGDAPIDPTDGTLIIDRSTAPATYTMYGYSQWQSTTHCVDEAPPDPPHNAGGRWTEDSGSFDGDVFAGGYYSGGDFRMRWRFARVGAVFTPPATGCSEPPTDQWTTVTAFDGTEANVTWTRVDTTGCLDTFEPHGTASSPPRSTSFCPTLTTEPASGPIAAGDGVLTIDRSIDPAVFRITGGTSWTATRTCTHADESVDTSSGGGGPWAYFRAEYDGDHFGGEFVDDNDDATSWWRFARP